MTVLAKVFALFKDHVNRLLVFMLASVSAESVDYSILQGLTAPQTFAVRRACCRGDVNRSSTGCSTALVSMATH